MRPSSFHVIPALKSTTLKIEHKWSMVGLLVLQSSRKLTGVHTCFFIENNKRNGDLQIALKFVKHWVTQTFFPYVSSLLQ